MFEYVKWCNSVEQQAIGSCSHVRFKTLRYSLKKLFRIDCFLGVNSRLFKTIHFFIVSLSNFKEIIVFKSFGGIAEFHPASKDGVSFSF